MYLLMYTVNYFVKMLILDTWYNKFHCNIEIEANRSRIRPIEESMGNKSIDLRKKTVERALARVQRVTIYNECILFRQYQSFQFLIK